MLKKNWKQVVFAIAIALLYIPMVYLGINTFFPEGPVNDCYIREPIRLAPCGVNDTACQEAEVKESQERQDCQVAYDKARREHEGGKYIALMIICLITSLIMLANLNSSIIYGLFFGVVITAFTGTIRYLDSKSRIGFALMVTLFVIIIYFVQKRRH